MKIRIKGRGRLRFDNLTLIWELRKEKSNIQWRDRGIYLKNLTAIVFFPSHSLFIFSPFASQVASKQQNMTMSSLNRIDIEIAFIFDLNK